MNSRMDRYNNEKTVVGSRTKRNANLYEQINSNDLKDVNLASNARILGENKENINVAKIKELLGEKYCEEPKQNHLEDIIDALDTQDTTVEETKEYDINTIIEKAKLDKDIDYKRDRLKKVRDTQYDILKGLDLENETEQELNEKEENLINLINTITEKELSREMNPLDILTDLKGSDNTVVLDGIQKEIEKKEMKESVKEEIKKEIDKTFYTNSLSFTKSDFDDFNDLKEDVKSHKILIYVLLIIVAITFIIGLIFCVNYIFKLNLF